MIKTNNNILRGLLLLKARIIIFTKQNIVNDNQEAIPKDIRTNAMNMNVDAVKIEVSAVDKTKKCFVSVRPKRS
jgi:hypothetical protein